MLDDTLTRLAPREVDGLMASWDLDTGGDWIEITGWFSPGLKLGEPRHEVPFVHRSIRTEAGIAECIEHIVADVRKRMTPAVVKRKPGRPRKVAA